MPVAMEMPSHDVAVALPLVLRAQTIWSLSYKYLLLLTGLRIPRLLTWVILVPLLWPVPGC